MIQRISGFFTGVVHRVLPDPLIFAILLTVLTFVLAFGLTPQQPADLAMMWGTGFWNLLAFSMQMAMILVTGHALASSAPVRRLLVALASCARTPAQGVMLVAFVAAIACAINWGFGLVLGAMFSREVARRVRGSDYRLLVASAYMGFLTWHGGLSGSVPLVAATKGNPMEKAVGLIPVTDTIFTGYNAFITIGLIVMLPILARLMMPKEGDVVSVDPALLEDPPVPVRKLGPDSTFAERLEESRALSILVALLCVAFLVVRFSRKGFALDIDTVNLVFLAAGLVLHGTPMAYARAVAGAARGASGIMIQFPFYAGIQALMDHSGLAGIITKWFVDIANVHTFPLLVFLSSAVINFAVPSGGGHWVVQGPFVMPAAQALGADLGKSAMAIAYGEAWTNMAQPFWALPALAIAGLGVRDIMGYCVTTLLFSGVVFIAGMYLF
ncbi:TIGR00366 family protein [Paraburkholderia caballeronis]|uniref:Short-chain fatty acids transporter n=1 Tax=Paraburkholderia caballeronis TaxID=416943 RepID=A0A1H7RLT8_9BURK|nr:TIGR00366 family protein [Paraburkholderia caballeronis]PXW23093.1 short-chain fatty acids transporter [Paraburkholderia caballeronis]PXW97757.1 short-chain fatty acids transporter [Paraburkholderia caballeronis]RAJ94727.1 short-chain fatty acids transporter [Paraburkholderia caballeronis]TDV11744.1 short-chain fatty acids transporter [Paraburkholderia caballeronis]TDV14825.1 short-chain fatty acids transporter [Paraburkholderia caballeronis]